MTDWPGQKVSGPAARPAAPAQGGGPALRPVLSLPDPRADREETRDQTRTDIAVEGNARAAEDAKFNRVTTYRKEFLTEPTVRQFREVQNATKQIIDLASRDTDKPGPGDIALIFSYMKTLDPGSVVREGEFATAQNAGGVPETVMNAYNRLLEGGRLSPDLKREFAATAASIYNARLNGYNTFAQDYRGLLEAEGVDPDAQGIRLAEPLAYGQEENPALIPGIRLPEMRGGLPVGTETDIRANRVGEDRISRAQNYFESIGIYPNDQAKIVAFWNANRGNPDLTPENVTAWYRANGYDQALLDPASIQSAVEAAKKGEVQFIFDSGESDDEYRDQLDAAIEERGINPEDIDRSAVAGASSGVTLGWNDEIMGALAAADEALKNGDIIGAYEANRDIRRRIRERAMEENPGVTLGAELVSSLALPVAGGRNAVARGGQAAVKAAAKTGAVVGGVAGAGYGEGVEGTALGAATGAGLGYVVGGQGEKLVRRLKLNRANRGRNDPSPSGGGGGTSAQNVADAKKFGIDISPGDAGGRSLKIVERILDNQPGSASVMNASRERLQGQMVDAVDNVASGFGSTTSFRGIGEAGQAGVKSWRDRFNAVAAKAYDAVPIKPETSATLSDSVAALDGLTSKITSNPKLAAMLEDKRLVGFLDALRGKSKQVSTGLLDEAGNPIMREVTEGGSLSWNDLKQLRSRIGEEIGEQLIGEGTLKSDLRGLYAALSRDMEATARAQGPAALKSFERANRLYKEGQERIERVWTSLLGPDGQRTPEAAAAVIQRIAREGKGSGDLRLLGELRRTTAKTGEWAQISNGVIRLLGQPLNSEGRQFSPRTFFQNYGDMSAEAKNLLFGGANKELRQNLDEFARVVGNVAASDGTRNASNTGMVLSGLAGVSTAGIPGLLAQTLGSYGASKLWTNPKFVAWATGYARLVQGAARGGSVNPAAHAKQMDRLSRIAAADSVIAADALGLQQQLLARFGPDRLAAESSEGSPTTEREKQ